MIFVNSLACLIECYNKYIKKRVNGWISIKKLLLIGFFYLYCFFWHYLIEKYTPTSLIG